MSDDTNAAVITNEIAEEDRVHEEKAEFVRIRSGVMPIRKHKEYMAQGGGCADTLDREMRDAFLDPVDGVDVVAVQRTAEANGVWNPRWGSLNPGMIRMNTANRLRAKARRGEEIVLVDREGREFQRGTFGIEATTLAKAQAAQAEKEANKAKAAEAKARADAAREERGKAIEARKAAGKAPQARVEAKAKAPRAKGKGRKAA